MATSYDIIAQKGVSLTLTLALKDDSGSAINLSGYSVLGQVKFLFGETGILASLNTQVLSAPSGQIIVTVDATGTKTFPVGIFYYNILIQSGIVVTNVLNGQFRVLPTVYGNI
jgi:hypothetical protein